MEKEPRMMRSACLSGCLVMLVASLAVAQPSTVNERLEQRLEKELRRLETGFIGHETVAVPEGGHPRKYLLLDFEKRENAQRDERQERIHKICMQILSNRDLVKSLSEDGFHMISVAFDRRHQYDCLQSMNRIRGEIVFPGQHDPVAAFILGAVKRSVRNIEQYMGTLNLHETDNAA